MFEGVMILAVAWLFGLLAIRQAPAVLWAVTIAVFAALINGLGQAGIAFPNSYAAIGWTGAILTSILLALSYAQIRKTLVTKPVFSVLRRALPRISETESAAIEAGTVGWDAELFTGRPDWQALRAVPGIELSHEERAFLEGPTEQLCKMLSDWDLRHNRREIPEHIWAFIKEQGFLGMLISKRYGGLGFSAQAQSLILGKIGSRSADAVVAVMVPNSLGPGELVEKYGTEEQKRRWLKPLAKGEEIPCFGLTGPHSGSDAADMRDVGIVCEREFEGRKTLGIKLDFEKRYITLAPVATVVGLAFKLYDPDRLLGGKEALGITLALIPIPHEGVEIGRRHYPSGMAFPNGPIRGRDVFIPLDWVIGGKAGIGQGWKFLMECLSAGRAISLPATGTAATKAALRVTTAYARIRHQFGLPIAHMEGIEEPLARMVENAYVNEAARALTAAMVSKGEKPAVISALLKYQTTERQRASIRDAMDIHGGKAICDGPKNYLQSAYRMVPVGITVEGANILTRSLMTFGQGVIRCHPWLYQEIKAAQMQDQAAGLAAFDQAFCGHFKYMLANISGSLFHNLTGGLFASQPENGKYTSYWYRQLARASRTFALVADVTAALLGGKIKIKQKISGRLADAFSELYLLSSLLKRYEDDGMPEADRDIFEMCARNAMYRFQLAIAGVLDNYPVPLIKGLLRVLAFPLGRRFKPAPDTLTHKVAQAAVVPGEVRDRLTRDIYVCRDPQDTVGLLEVTLDKVVKAEPLMRYLRKAERAGKIRRDYAHDWLKQAVEQNVLSAAEADQMREVEELIGRVIAVDDFAPEELTGPKAIIGKAASSSVADENKIAAE